MDVRLVRIIQLAVNAALIIDWLMKKSVVRIWDFIVYLFIFLCSNFMNNIIYYIFTLSESTECYDYVENCLSCSSAYRCKECESGYELEGIECICIAIFISFFFNFLQFIALY